MGRKMRRQRISSSSRAPLRQFRALARWHTLVQPNITKRQALGRVRSLMVLNGQQEEEWLKVRHPRKRTPAFHTVIEYSFAFDVQPVIDPFCYELNSCRTDRHGKHPRREPKHTPLRVRYTTNSATYLDINRECPARRSVTLSFHSRYRSIGQVLFGDVSRLAKSSENHF